LKKCLKLGNRRRSLSLVSKEGGLRVEKSFKSVGRRGQGWRERIGSLRPAENNILNYVSESDLGSSRGEGRHPQKKPKRRTRGKTQDETCADERKE